MAFRINPLSAAAARRQDDRAGVGLDEFLDQIDGLVGVMVEDDDRQVRGDFLGAGRGLLIAGQDFGEPERRDPPQQPLQAMLLDSSMGSTRTIRITSFMVFDSG